MILQRDLRLNNSINKFGCYLMCIFFLVNKYTGYMFSPQIIKDLYKVFISHGYIDKDCFIIDPEAIFEFLQMPVQYTQRHELPIRQCRNNEIEVLMFKLARLHKHAWKHFAVGNGKGTVTYDPYGVSRAVAEGRLISKRIFRRL